MNDIDYGYCVVIKGAHKGEIVYYDDDEGTKAIVYPRDFLGGGFFMLPLKWLRAATHEEVATHILAGHGLWPTAKTRMFHEILVADMKMSEDMPEPVEGAPPPDIQVDTMTAFKAVLDQNKPSNRRAALIRLMVLTTTWVELLEREMGPTQEDLAAQKQARKYSGLTPPSD